MYTHSAFLFDIVPELDEYHPDSLTLKIGPTIYESPFDTRYMENPECSEDDFDRKEQYLDLQVLYENYKRCKVSICPSVYKNNCTNIQSCCIRTSAFWLFLQKDTGKLVRSVKEALISLDVFKSINDRYLDRSLQFEHINKTVRVIDSVILRGYFSVIQSA